MTGESARVRRHWSNYPQLALGLVVALFAIYVLLEASRYPRDPRTSVQPSFFPVLLAVGLLVCSAVILWQAFNRQRGKGPVDTGEVQPPGRITLAYAGCLLGYCALLRVLGFAGSTFLFLVAATYLMGERRPLRLVVIPALLTGAVYLVFSVFLRVSFPSAAWW